MPPSRPLPVRQVTDMANRAVWYTERVGVFWDVEVSQLSLTCLFVDVSWV